MRLAVGDFGDLCEGEDGESEESECLGVLHCDEVDGIGVREEFIVGKSLLLWCTRYSECGD